MEESLDINRIDINRSQRLFIELGTALHLESDNSKLTISSELIGMKVGKYLIIRLSENNLGKNRLKKEDTFWVKYICSDDVFGFNTRVIMIIEQPDHLVFLEYPDQVESCNIRSQARIDCFFSVEMILENNSSEKGVVVNINPKGCLCLVRDLPSQDVSRNSRVTVKFPYAMFETVSISGTVKSIRRDREKMSLGIMFDEIDTYAKTILTTLMPALKI